VLKQLIMKAVKKNAKKAWSSKEKLQIVLEGMKGATVPQICKEHGIAQSMHYRWRDQFLANAESIFGLRWILL
jgi:transposase-like protein